MSNQKKLEEMEPWIVKADKEIAAKLFKELEHPKGLGDTYAGDVMRKAAERIEHLAEGRFKLDFRERFPHWNPIKCKMLCWVWPKIWRSDDQEFLKSLEWGACVLNGEYVRAQKLHDGLRTLWDTSVKHPSGIRGWISHPCYGIRHLVQAARLGLVRKVRISSCRSRNLRSETGKERAGEG